MRGDAPVRLLAILLKKEKKKEWKEGKKKKQKEGKNQVEFGVRKKKKIKEWVIVMKKQKDIKVNRRNENCLMLIKAVLDKNE
jgi:hypothetical protein